MRLSHGRRCGAALLAAWALLIAQAIGLAHAVAHPYAHERSVAQAVSHAHANAFDAQHEQGSLQCQLLDQLLHADGLAAPPQSWTFPAPDAGFAAAPAELVRATCACGYHARGPPLNLA